MNYAEEIIKLVLQIRNESGLKRLYGFAMGTKESEDDQGQRLNPDSVNQHSK